MQQIDIQEKKIDRALFQFVFPFSLKQGTESTISSFLKKSGFKLFQLNQLEDECAYYGDFKVSHRDMEAYYLSFTNKILFPHSEKEKGLHRYSKPLNIRGKLITDTECIPFQIHSVDLTICPYELGFLTIRTELKPFTSMPLSHSLEFADRFRVLEPRTRKDSSTKREAKQSLESLFRYQENVNAKKDSLLLLILTLYSVVGQMLGMGLVVSDFIGRIKWRNIRAYNPVEYFALILAASGVIISLILGIQSLYQWIIDQRNRKKWVKQTVLSSTKE
ncbi:hypothetical protein [Priestia megaterium]|uniref:hypothetical protein n=1 Tax=Priestia megaterium TaxID=1404 RepID=UPI002E1C3946|nr:hypothetical protein [Priestia megaterium]MED4254545.1 hypothetical protein [Priestia megaterium]